MKSRKILYVSIVIICVIAILIGVYYQIFKTEENDNINQNNNTNQNINSSNNTPKKQDSESLKLEFNSLFDNSFNTQEYDVSNIKKIEGAEKYDIIESIYTLKEEKEEKYNVNINLPLFNIDNEVVDKFNETTQNIFTNKASEILYNSEQYSIYNVDFVGYINENIISLIIKATLKQGNNPQRLIVQTYNYDLKEEKEVNLNDILKEQEIDSKDVNNKIKQTIEEANNNSKALSNALGQKIYQRDIQNKMYNTDNVDYFFIGEYGQIYIIYPYGNANYTSEIDIIKL